MADTENKKPGEDFNYDTSKSYNQLVYGRYIFLAKMLGAVALVLLALYLLLTNIGKSLGTANELLTIDQYLSLAEKQRAQFRVKMQLMLIDDILRYRQDTVFVVVDDPKYLLPQDKGVYDYPDQRAIYGCRLYALELALKRTLTEMNFPFVYTQTVLADSLKNHDLSGFQKFDSYFPLYITKKIKPSYTVTPAADSGTQKSVTIFLPDSIAAFFKELYAGTNTTKRLMDKYVGEGPCGPYKNYSYLDFFKLPEEAQKEQRRAFLKLSEAEQNKARYLDVGMSSDPSNCFPWDEKPGKGFNNLTERKIHELEISQQISPFYNQATFALMYPMGRGRDQNFLTIGQNRNAMLLIGIKSNRAPASYVLDRKDCPRIIKQGIFADITDIVNTWEQKKYFPKFPLRDASYQKRIFGIPQGILTTDCISYRRDWLEEPGIIGWFQKKGWIHPVDKRPFIPLSWTYADFRAICKLVTESDPTRKRRGFVDRPGPLMYLDAYSLFHMSPEHYLIPNPTGKTTWLFNKDDPVYREGMKTVHDMYWIDKSIRTGVEVSYASAQDDFSGGRVAMCYGISGGIIFNSLLRKYTIFGKGRAYGDIVGITSIPGCPYFPNLNPGDCNMIGFNPNLNQEQLHLSVEWVKARFYGDFVNNSMVYEVKEAKAFGTESILYRNAIASVYSMDYKQYNIDFRAVFPVNYLDFYDDLREAQKYPPSPDMGDFGLTQPLNRAIAEQIETMFQKVQMDSIPDYNRILNEGANYINTTYLNFLDENATDKLKAYYAASDSFLQTSIPAYYTHWKARNEKYWYWQNGKK